MTQDELKALIEDLRLNHEYCPKEVILQAADELARLAQPEPLEYWNAVEGWVKIDEVREHLNSVGCGTIYKTAGEGRVPLCLAQPEQEPVIGKWSLREVYFDEDGEPISHRSPPQRTEQPAQRTWVGLTEQDLDYLCNLAYTGDEEFALAVQAKLMEKNA